MNWWRHTTIRTRAIVAAALACCGAVVLTWALYASYWHSGGRERLIAALDRGYAPPFDLLLLSLLPPMTVAILFGITIGALVTLRMGHMEAALRKVELGDWRAELPGPPARDYVIVHRAFSSMTRALDELTTRLQHADTQRRRLFADLAHELSTPTASIVAVADALSDPKFGEELRGKLLKALDEESRRLERLIKDVRELANLDDPDVVFRFAPTDLSDVVQRFADRTNVVSGRANVRVDAARAFVVELDEIRIEQILTNVVTNSHRYTPASGFVRVAIKEVDGGVQIVVEDTGPGVRDSVLPRLGERLLRVDPSRARATGGAGLGLSIVSAIVHRHHGTLTFEHGELGGLAARITLPLAQPADAAIASPASPSPTSLGDAPNAGPNATVGSRASAP